MYTSSLVSTRHLDVEVEQINIAGDTVSVEFLLRHALKFTA